MIIQGKKLTAGKENSALLNSFKFVYTHDRMKYIIDPTQ